jgi:hypothetical protein
MYKIGCGWTGGVHDSRRLDSHQWVPTQVVRIPFFAKFSPAENMYIRIVERYIAIRQCLCAHIVLHDQAQQTEQR